MLVYEYTKMNNVTILLMFLLFATNVQCKPEFKILLTRVLVTKQNTTYVNGSYWLSKINRYTNGLNGVLDIRYEVSHETKAKVQCFEFFHNEYRPFAINLEREICSFFDLEYKTFFYPDFVKTGAHMPEPKCPIPKGIYTFANLTINEKNYPTALPFNKAMLELSFWYKTEVTIAIQFYVTFDRDIIIREKYM